MRKYFLLSAVAMFAATNANAEIASARFGASVRLTIPTQIECSNINFGNIFLRKAPDSGKSVFKMATDGTVTQHLHGMYRSISVEDSGVGMCTLNGENISGTATIPQSLTIYLGDTQNVYVNNVTISSDGILTGDLTILPEAEIISDDMIQGSTTITFTYE